ncbi:tRNA nucleotidyltransferase [Lachnospiraceae bacterium KM106-2]|nr:tRNA nucleotidyltransferase [Lachnospiraceae bacterium KM106-2]
MQIKVPSNVKLIIEELNKSGFQAYAVGGCVRDSILGRVPGDWDITTSAKPMQVKEIFSRTVDTGIEHGTVTVMIGKEGYEVTTYRIDGEYEDNRHPKSVEFTSNLVEDLKRRDFTINAMAYNDEEGIVDVFEGLKDIERKVIRCVGTPQHRFDEDALRILRAIRFAGQLGFHIEDETREAIIEKAPNLSSISAERIRVELTKLLISKGPDRLIMGYETGITKVVLPEFDLMLETKQNNHHHKYDVGRHSIHSVEEISRMVKEADIDSKHHVILCWTMLLHDVGKPVTKTVDEQGIDHFHGHQIESEKIAKKVLKRLKFDNYTIDMVCRLIRWHDKRYELNEVAMRQTASQIGKDIMDLLFMVQEADVLAQSEDLQEEKLKVLEEAKIIYKGILERKECLTLKELSVNGGDLIALGLKPGKQLGEILNELLQRVLVDPELNKKEVLLSLVDENKLS